jgi:acyl-coenzyme A synthetase/AMP-(fatty) acid ligase
MIKHRQGDPRDRAADVPTERGVRRRRGGHPHPVRAGGADREALWAGQARDLLHWDTDFTTTLDWSRAPVAEWFVNGELNPAYNGVGRHVEAAHGDRIAIHFVGEPGDRRDISYAQLQRVVSTCANASVSLGISTGDLVAIYLPMIPEAVIAMLACARIGAPYLGLLVLTEPWPSMLRGIWGDPERYRDTYWSRFDGPYFAGDGAKKNDDGDLWLLGRVDDVMNVSGHRLSTAEIESALVSHPSVAEAAVVGATDETTG